MRFASLLSGGFTAMAVINSPENKLANRTSVQWKGNLSWKKAESNKIIIIQLRTNSCGQKKNDVRKGTTIVCSTAFN